MTPTLHDITVHPTGARSLPLCIEAHAPVQAAEWLAANCEWVEEKLLSHGALLFRGFGVGSAAALQSFSSAISEKFPEPLEESSPRSSIEGPIMTSTDYPSDYPIQFHNEYSYSHAWPMRLYFACFQPAQTGGQTPIADSRRVLVHLPASIRDRFARHGVLYRRNYVEGLGVSWRAAFRTEDRAEVERKCQTLGIEAEWNGDSLTTRQKAEAILRHPKSRDEVWFNHAFFFHPQSLEPESLREFMLGEPEDEISTITYYGDGSPIEPETIEAIRAAFEAERSEFDWRTGDVLIVENMLAAHARRPYTGTRKIAVAMTDPHFRSLEHAQ